MRALCIVFLVVAFSARAATPMVSAGNAHSVALHADGTVLTWGDDSSGQLGLGRTLAAAAPAPVVGISNVSRVASGGNHVVALLRDGSVWAWGINKLGQLGDGSTTSRSGPAPVLGMSNVQQVSALGAFTLALKNDRSVWSWGENYSGQRGLDEAGLEPTPVPGLPAIRMVAAGGKHGMALDMEGNVWSWGENEAGQLGDGTKASRSTPRRIGALSGVALIAAGAAHSIAVKTDGTVLAWGSNYAGQVGNNSESDQSMPVALSGLAGGATELAPGVFHTLARMGDGTLRAWGDGYSGQLGDGRASPSPLPIAIPGLSNVTAIAAGAFFSVARTSDGSVWAWGDNTAGEIADGTTMQRDTPYRLNSLPPIDSIAAGGYHAFGVGTDGRVYAWGSNEYGELGDASKPLKTTPSLVPGVSGIVRVAGGGDHTLALRADGSVLAWGGNGLGQLGDGTRQGRSAAGAVAGLAGVSEISAGYFYSTALKTDGTVWSWGYNYGGQLGQGLDDITVNERPAQIMGLASIRAISSGGSHTLAVTNTGTVVAWGANGAGQAGDGSTTDRYAPVAVPGLTGIRAVAAGGTHSLALGNDGRVYSWGLNYSGELGDGTNNDRASAAFVPGLSDIVAIGAGDSFSFAVKRGGTVYAWGANWSSQLGDGSGLSQTSPVPVPVLQNIVMVSGGGTNGIALKADGTVYGWGNNIDGRVGDGTLVTRDTPVVVVGEDGEGSLEGNDWYVNLDPSIQKTIPPELVPVFLVVTETASGEVNARLQFRGADVGSNSSVFVFALAPPSVVRGAALKESQVGPKARGSPKDAPVACALAQLNAQGQLVSVSAASLQAYVSGVLSGQGASVNVLKNVPPSNVSGATFYVGYGANGTAMLINGTTRSVVNVPASLNCQPQPPQTGWWYNPLEPGRGFSIESRGRNIFFAAFHYDPSGRATWNFSAGATSLDGSLYTGDFLAAANGQTLTSAYKLPSLSPAGNLTLAFSDATHGTMTWPGGAVPIERQAFVPNGLTAAPQANVPETGWWWNPQESGRGFFIEWQSGFADLAGYMYDDAGNPTWYISAFATPDARTFSGSWWSFANGQSMGGPFKPATRTNDNVGSVRIDFATSTTATMTLPDGRRIALERQRF